MKVLFLKCTGNPFAVNFDFSRSDVLWATAMLCVMSLVIQANVLRDLHPGAPLSLEAAKALVVEGRQPVKRRLLESHPGLLRNG